MEFSEGAWFEVVTILAPVLIGFAGWIAKLGNRMSVAESRLDQKRARLDKMENELAHYSKLDSAVEVLKNSMSNLDRQMEGIRGDISKIGDEIREWRKNGK